MDSADLEIRQDFDDMYACKRFGHIRWHSTDLNGLGGGVPDGFELYLLEYMLKHPESLPVDIEYTVILEAWLENLARMLDYVGAGHPGAVNALAAYMTVGDDPSNAIARIFSAFFGLYPTPGVPIHTFKHLPQHLALDADPDGDGYTNLQEWEYIKLFEANPDALADLYAQACLDPAIHCDATSVETVTVTIEVIGEGTVYPGPGTHTFAKYPLSWPDPDCPAPACADPGNCATPECAHPDCPDSGYCAYNVIQVSAAPAQDWAFRCWWGDLVGIREPDATLSLPHQRTVTVEFVHRPGIAELDLLSAFAAYLQAFEPGADIMTFDKNEIDYIDGEEVFAGNGIPDAAELALLETVLKAAGLDLSVRGGIAHGRVFQAWQDNLSLAVQTLPGKPVSYANVLAAYMTLGEYGSARYIEDAIEVTYSVDVIPDDYDRSRARFFGADDNPDRDLQDLIGEWNTASQQPWPASVDAFVQDALYTPSPASSNPGGGQDDCDDCIDDTRDFNALAVWPEWGSVSLDGDSGSASSGESLTATLSSKLDATAEAGENSVFAIWSAEDTLIDGSDDPSETQFLVLGAEEEDQNGTTVMGVFSSGQMKVRGNQYADVRISAGGARVEGPDENYVWTIIGPPGTTVTLEGTAINPSEYAIHGWEFHSSSFAGLDPRFTLSSTLTRPIGGFVELLVYQKSPPPIVPHDYVQVKVEASEGGMVLSSYSVRWPGFVAGTLLLPRDAIATLNALPNRGYRFVRWADAPNAGPSRDYVPISHERTFRAEFEEIPVTTLEATIEDCGYLTIVPAKKFYRVGDNVLVRATAAHKQACCRVLEKLAVGPYSFQWATAASIFYRVTEDNISSPIDVKAKFTDDVDLDDGFWTRVYPNVPIFEPFPWRHIVRDHCGRNLDVMKEGAPPDDTYHIRSWSGETKPACTWVGGKNANIGVFYGAAWDDSYPGSWRNSGILTGFTWYSVLPCYVKGTSNVNTYKWTYTLVDWRSGAINQTIDEGSNPPTTRGVNYCCNCDAAEHYETWVKDLCRKHWGIDPDHPE